MAALSWPLVRKELRQSLRGRAALIIENLYLLLLVGVAAVEIATSAGDTPMWELGRGTFWMIMGLQSALLGLVAAALAAATLTAEREQKTEDILLVTPTPVRQVVWSKAVGMGAILATLVLLSVPVSVICLLLGGLTWQAVLLAYLATGLWLTLSLSIGLALGAHLRRTIAAVPLAIVAVVVLESAAAAMATSKLPHAAMAGNGALALVMQEIPLRFFGLRLPIVAASVLMCLPLAAALTELALDRVRLPHRRRPMTHYVLGTVIVLIASALALGVAVTAHGRPDSPPWDSLLVALVVHGVILIVGAVDAASGPGRRDHAALTGRRLGVVEGLFGGGPRAGGRWLMALGAVLLGGWVAAWLAAGPPLGVATWRVGLAVACLMAGIWVACLLAQVAAFWQRLRRNWQRYLVALLLVAVVFAAPPILAAALSRGQEMPPPAAVVLLLTNPVAGCIMAFDPVAPVHGSPFAARAEGLVPLGVYPLALMLAAVSVVSLLLWRMRRRFQQALAAGTAPPEREAQEAPGG